MNKKIKNLIQIFLFCLIGLFLFLNLYKVLSWKDTAADYDSTINTFYQLEQNKVDVLFLGSSHCFCAINVGQLWEEHGIAAYSLAMSGQDLVSSYYCIEEALKTQKPKVVCLDLYGVLTHGYNAGSEGNIYRNTLGYKPSKTAYKVASDIAEDNKELKGQLLSRLPIVHTRYKELQQEDFMPVGPNYMGFHCAYDIGDTNGRGIAFQFLSDAEPLPLEPAEDETLKKIITICKENNIRLCLFVAPFYSYDHEQQKFKYVEQLASENDIEFLNFIELEQEINLEPSQDFLDWGHVNYYGAEKVCNYMGDFLCNQYQLADHRGQNGYHLWEENAVAMNHEKSIHSLKTENELTVYLNKLKKLEDCVILISTAGVFRNESNAITMHMRNIGIPTEQFYAGGSWLIENSEMEYITHTGLYNAHWCYDYTTLSVSGSPDGDFVFADRTNVVFTENGIVIVIYDKVLQEVVECAELSTDNNYRLIH